MYYVHEERKEGREASSAIIQRGWGKKKEKRNKEIARRQEPNLSVLPKRGPSREGGWVMIRDGETKKKGENMQRGHKNER